MLKCKNLCDNINSRVNLGGNIIMMTTPRLILSIVFILISIIISILVLMQEGKSAGLGAISGAAETYWGKNKGRSMEGKLVKMTTILVVAFLVIAVILNLTMF